MAGKVHAHDVRSGRGFLPLFDQVRERFVHERLKLTAFLGGECAHGRKDFGIDLSSEFRARLWDELLLLHQAIMTYHDTSRNTGPLREPGVAELKRMLDQIRAQAG